MADYLVKNIVYTICGDLVKILVNDHGENDKEVNGGELESSRGGYMDSVLFLPHLLQEEVFFSNNIPHVEQVDNIILSYTLENKGWFQKEHFINEFSIAEPMTARSAKN